MEELRIGSPIFWLEADLDQSFVGPVMEECQQNNFQPVFWLVNMVVDKLHRLLCIPAIHTTVAQCFPGGELMNINMP